MTTENTLFISSPTLQFYAELQEAFNHFNQTLFENKLPECMITLQRESNTHGYYSVNRFIRKDGQKIDEIAMNPEYFSIRSIPETLSTLVHEMVHLQQQHFGAPGRGRYHNHQWAEWMEYIGLIPSHTGEVGGKRTGDKMSHYILKAGKFDQACQQLITQDYKLSWMDRFPPPKAITQTIQLLKTRAAIQTVAVSVSSPEVEDAEEVASQPANVCHFESKEHFIEELSTIGIHVPEVLINGEIIETVTKNKSNRLKYICSSCQVQVWGKPQLNLICGDCRIPLSSV